MAKQSRFLCPNPTCTHEFAPDAIRGASALHCPRCGTVFHFKKVASIEDGDRSPKQPLRQRTADDEKSALVFVPHTGSVRKRRPAWLTWSRRAAAVVVLTAGAIGLYSWIKNTAWPWYAREFGGSAAADNTRSISALNCRFTHPGKAWHQDDSTRVFGAAQIVALRRTEPNAWIAVAARDYESRAPRDGEMVEMLVDRLGEAFKAFEWELRPEGELAGQRAQQLFFQGDSNHVPMTGACFFFTSHGIAYWVATWAPARSAASVQDELAKARQGLALLQERQGWVVKRPEPRLFRGNRVAYSLRDDEALWEAWATPMDVDSAADLLLQAKDRVATKDVSKMAQVAVLVLEPQPDLAAAAKAARARLGEQQKKTYPATTMEELHDHNGADDPQTQVGEAPGRIVKMKVKNSASRERFVILAVVRLPEHLMVIQCECDWKRRSLWEGDFKQLLRTFSPRAES